MGSNKYCTRAYEFFVEKDTRRETFTLDELEARTGWKRSTIEIYVTKKWSQYITREAEGKYRVEGITNLPLDAFIRLHSQKSELFVDPLRPILPRRVEDLVDKSREAALLAIQVYNNPFSVFRSHGFIVFMIIAWTSIFHAYFEKNGREFTYKDETGNDMLTKVGEPKAWDISACIKAYYGSRNCSERANLEFLNQLRDKIEHRYLPAIDLNGDVAGACQATLLNYEKLLVDNFGDYYALGQSLAFSLQFSSVVLKQQLEAKRRFQAKEYQEVREFIKNYKGSLPDEIINRQEFSFRVFLLPALGNHAKSADYCIQFVQYDPDNPEEMAQYEKDIVMIKNRIVQAANVGNYSAKQVAEQVQKRIGKAFRVIPEHVKSWKMYNVRPRQKTADGCKTEFCQFDVVHRDFVYTQAWIEFLVKRLDDEEEYKRLVNYKDQAV